MERVKGFFQHISLYIAALAKWLGIGGFVGLVGGAVGAAFHIGVEQATALRLAHPWILWLLPVGGITEKIEGFYDFCCWRQTEGPWGVIFPAATSPR